MHCEDLREYGPAGAHAILGISEAEFIKRFDAGEIRGWKTRGGHRRVLGLELRAYRQRQMAALAPPTPPSQQVVPARQHALADFQQLVDQANRKAAT